MAILDPRRDLEILDGLSALVDQSLVRPPAEGAGEPRFDMLQLIREFAAERLAETDEAAVVARRHAEWVLALVDVAGPALEAGSGVDGSIGWLRSMTTCARRSAGRSTTANGRSACGSRPRMWRFWQQRGHLRRGSRLVRSAHT